MAALPDGFTDVIAGVRRNNKGDVDSFILNPIDKNDGDSNRNRRGIR